MVAFTSKMMYSFDRAIFFLLFCHWFSLICKNHEKIQFDSVIQNINMNNKKWYKSLVTLVELMIGKVYILLICIWSLSSSDCDELYHACTLSAYLCQDLALLHPLQYVLINPCVGFLLRWEVSDPELVLLMGKMVVYLRYLSFIQTITQHSEYWGGFGILKVFDGICNGILNYFFPFNCWVNLWTRTEVMASERKLLKLSVSQQSLCNFLHPRTPA